ncbi:Putative O-methyltransferase [Corynebacterium confusum]|nr:Putative O-methyltransferase [Corynebacterium confusum]
MPRLKAVTTTAFDALQSYIGSTSAPSEALAHARDHAQEYSLPLPDEPLGQLISTLAAASTGHAATPKAQAIVISPAAAVVGLYVLEGLSESGSLTCIDPEAEHQAAAKASFREAGYPPSRVRYLPSRPLDVMSRLASESYQVIYADVHSLDLPALVDAAWPLLSPHGTLVLPNALLDGTLGDSSRTDRATQSARQADAAIRELEGAVVTRLPLGGGVTLVTKL